MKWQKPAQQATDFKGWNLSNCESITAQSRDWRRWGTEQGVDTQSHNLRGMEKELPQNSLKLSSAKIKCHTMRQEEMQKTSVSFSRVPTSQPEHAVDRTIGHKGYCQRHKRAIVRWYGREPENSTLEVAEIIPKHSIKRLFRCTGRTQRRAQSSARKEQKQADARGAPKPWTMITSSKGKTVELRSQEKTVAHRGVKPCKGL